MIQTWKHLRAIILLPDVLMVVIPTTILFVCGLDTFGLWQDYPAACVALSVVGSIPFCLPPPSQRSTMRPSRLNEGRHTCDTGSA